MPRLPKDEGSGERDDDGPEIAKRVCNGHAGIREGRIKERGTED